MLLDTARCTCLSRSIKNGVNMAKSQQTEDGWLPCPPGTLVGLSTNLKSQERWTQVRRVSSVAAGLIIAVAAGIWYSGQQPPGMENHSYGGITCMEVRDSMPQMMDGSASEDLMMKVQAHLAECPQCAEMARKMKQRAMHAATQSAPHKQQSSSESILLAADSR